MKPRARTSPSTTVNLTVPDRRSRRYLTGKEIERLMDCARRHSRHGHRDATMVLVAYRHGLRASEVCDLQWHQPKAGCTSIARSVGSRAFTRSVVMKCAHYASFGAKTPRMPSCSFLSGVDQ